MTADNPTLKTYDGLNRAYAFFNDRLFAGELPAYLVTLQRAKKAYGYFAGGRFGSKDGKTVTDEIALNPSHFRDRTTEQSLSTLVHEMVHLWQHHFGKPSRAAYHNKEWAAKMHMVGLVPSDTGQPGGKERAYPIIMRQELSLLCSPPESSGYNPSLLSKVSGFLRNFRESRMGQKKCSEPQSRPLG